MKPFQPVFLLFAMLAASALMAVGIFIAEQSLIGVILSFIAFIAIMGAGFVKKKRMREKGML
jgi:predicted membrane protein